MNESHNYNSITHLDQKQNYYNFKKNFSNRILVFFQKYSFSNETVKEGFIEIDIEELFSISKFSMMIEEFCKDNKIDDSDKFFKECFSLLEQHGLGRILNGKSVEIKIDDLIIRNEILQMLKQKQTGVTYIEIFEHISKEHNNFFMNDYVRYVIGQLMESGQIQLLSQNTYQLL